MAAIDRQDGLHQAVHLARLLTPVLLWAVVLLGLLVLMSFGVSLAEGL